MSDEIKLIARDLCLAIHNEKGQMIYGPACNCERVEQAILTQVKKARREALEECVELAKNLPPSIHQGMIIKQIRNKLEKE